MVLVLVHGGAANIPQDQWDDKMNACVAAARAGCGQLLDNKSAVDSVVASVSSMENDCSLNAGFGSSLTIQGTVENDAIVINGQDLQVGAVACVTRIRNPVQLARLVLEQSHHCILSGEGAHQFAQQHQMELIENRELIDQRAKDRLAKSGDFAQTIRNSMTSTGGQTTAITSNGTTNGCKETNGRHCSLENGLDNKKNGNNQALINEHDTVGAVAVDANGHLACATSTGGLTGKAIGRIGDSPLVGCGGWAENGVCAISTTGHGELIMRVALCKHIAMLRSECGLSVEQAVDKGLEYMQQRVGGAAGVVAIDSQGKTVIKHTTPHMVWACADSERKQITYGISQHDLRVTSLDIN